MSLAMPVAAPPQASAFHMPGVGAQPAFDMGVEAEDAAPEPDTAAAASWRTIDANGRLREESLPDTDRHLTVLMHLSPLAFIWIGPFALAIPLVMWLIRREESAFADDHGRETVNFLLSFVVLHFLLGITIIGLVLIPVLWVIACVNVVRGSLAASRSEYFRYPMTIRFLSDHSVVVVA